MSRVRERSISPQSGNYHEKKQSLVNGVPVWGSEYISPPMHVRPAHYQKMTDEVIPGFKRRSAAGEIFNNHYSNYQRWASYDGTLYGEYSMADDPSTGAPFFAWGWNRTTNGCFMDKDTGFGQYPHITYPDTEALEAEATIECRGNINKTELNLPVFAAEWKRTRQIHRDVCKALEALASARGTGKARKALANAELTFRYGVMPLLYDLESALRLLNKKWSPRYTARGFASENVTAKGTFTHTHWYGTSTFTSEIRVDRSVRVGCLYTTDETARLAANLGFTRPLSVAWELVTLSFVVDWLIDVGSWLDAIQPDGASKKLASWVGVRTDIVTSRVITEHTPPSNPRIRNISVSGRMIDFVSERIRRPSQLSVPFVPALGSGLSQLRSLDAAALLSQRFGSKK